MAKQTLKCPRCKGSLETGRILDRCGGSNQLSIWSPGEPKKFIFGMVKANKGSMPVQTYRCRDCGYLESYAVETPK